MTEHIIVTLFVCSEKENGKTAIYKLTLSHIHKTEGGLFFFSQTQTPPKKIKGHITAIRLLYESLECHLKASCVQDKNLARVSESLSYQADDG